MNHKMAKNLIRFDFNSGKFSSYYGIFASAEDLQHTDHNLGCMNVEYHVFNKNNHSEVLDRLIERFKDNKGIVRKNMAMGFY